MKATFKNGYFKIRRANAAEPRFIVSLHAANHEALSVSETLNQKGAAYTNIKAQIKASGGRGAMVLDCTEGGTPQASFCDPTGTFHETDAIVISIPEAPEANAKQITEPQSY